jgi:hypothetical protein
MSEGDGVAMPEKWLSPCAQAALARADAAPPAPLRQQVVKDAVKQFNLQIISVPDYLHNRGEAVLDALLLIQKILLDIVNHHGRNPKDASKPVRSNISL